MLFSEYIRLNFTTNSKKCKSKAGLFSKLFTYSFQRRNPEGWCANGGNQSVTGRPAGCGTAGEWKTQSGGAQCLPGEKAAKKIRAQHPAPAPQTQRGGAVLRPVQGSSHPNPAGGYGGEPSVGRMDGRRHHRHYCALQRDFGIHSGIPHRKDLGSPASPFRPHSAGTARGGSDDGPRPGSDGGGHFAAGSGLPGGGGRSGAGKHRPFRRGKPAHRRSGSGEQTGGGPSLSRK